LRAIPLEFYCIDRCSPARSAGKKFFTALTSSEICEWKVITVKENINLKTKTPIARKNKAALVCAVNFFNEAYEDLPHNNSEALRRMAANIAFLMNNQASPDACILTVEPGVPQSGHFISLLRGAFLELNRPPLSPCPHSGDCPMPGGKSANIKKRWCHFAFTAQDAPKELCRLSAAAGIPKERLVFSYLLTGAQTQTQAVRMAAVKTAEKVRVISDAFPLPDKKSDNKSDKKFGRYGCCAGGLVLLTGNKTRIEKIASGELICDAKSGAKIDAKSGALIMEVK
jgi:hypothetical protein